MKQFDGVLICTDLDGTLLKNDKTISEENIKAIEFFKENGGLFTFVTGRVPATADNICKMINPNISIGCVNGGGVYNYQNKEYQWITALDSDVTELLECVDKTLPEVSIQVNTEKCVCFAKDNIVMSKFREITNIPYVPCDYRNMGEPILKIVFGVIDEDTVLKLTELLNNHPLSDKFSFVRSEKYLYEILPKNISKATALEKIVELNNLDMTKTIAIGDYYNDIDVVKHAHLGISVSNGCDALKEVADMVTVSNEESAIAQVIYDLYYERINL